MKLREYKQGDLRQTREAITLLKRARDLLRDVGAGKTLDRIRHALKSAEGAERHMKRIASEHARHVPCIGEPKCSGGPNPYRKHADECPLSKVEL